MQMFYERNVFNLSVKLQECTQCVALIGTECKHKPPQDAFKNRNVEIEAAEAEMS